MLKGKRSKDLGKLKGRWKALKGGRKSGSDEKGQVLDEPILGDLKFPKKVIEIPNCLW